MDRPPFPELHYDELQRIVRETAPELVELAGSVGSDWLDEADAEALVDVALDYFLEHQLGPDSEPLPNIDILGDSVAAFVEQQRRSFWQTDRRDDSAVVETETDGFGADLTRAILEDFRLLLSRRDDVAIAYLAHFQYRTFPPDLLVITQKQVDEILADEDRDFHAIAPAEWGHAQIFLPQEEGNDQWELAEQVRDRGREATALAAVHRAAEALAAQFPNVVVLAFDYDAEDEQLAETLHRILTQDAPLRALL